MARGGRRAGTTGTHYPNRTDLRTPSPGVPTGLPYGEHTELANAQRATPGAAPAAAPPPAAAQAPIPQPGSLPWMHPTGRPNEPVQAGLASGPGPGPESLGLLQGNAPNDPLTQAVAALNALGPKADAETTNLRDAMNATLANRAAP